MKKTMTQNSGSILIRARQNSISQFIGIEHRLETVAEKNGVEFINDSKSTDFTTAMYSLNCMTKPVIWIVGASEENYSVFSEVLRDKVKAVVVFGNTKDKNFDYLRYNSKHFALVKTLDDAVKAAVSVAFSGDAVLFSPACPSYDLFESYKQRGEYFRNEVLNK